MPLKSKAQEKYLWSEHPDVAQEFEDKTSKSQKSHLPEHVKNGFLTHEYKDGDEAFDNSHEHGMSGTHGMSLAPAQIAAIKAKGGGSGISPPKMQGSTSGKGPAVPIKRASPSVLTDAPKAPKMKAPNVKKFEAKPEKGPKAPKVHAPKAHTGGGEHHNPIEKAKKFGESMQKLGSAAKETGASVAKATVASTGTEQVAEKMAKTGHR